MLTPKCRFCASSNMHEFLDLGMSPLCQTHITVEQLNAIEAFYPLRTFICENCLLVQLDQYVSPGDIFSEYAYFSSYSASWVQHAADYVDKITERLSLGVNDKVIEIASNDGYLLQHFVKKNIPCLGIEPAENVAKVAIEKGVPSEVVFLGEQSAKKIIKKHGQAKLVIGNNVLAHVPDLNDFIRGLKTLLSSNGVITMEFPHLLQLMQNVQFDTIYHEHFSYFSFKAVNTIFSHHALKIIDVEELKSHGGSLRIYTTHSENHDNAINPSIDELLEREENLGFTNLDFYKRFKQLVEATKRNILEFLIEQKNLGKSIIGYGAPGKANTLFNYCGIRHDFLEYVVDKNPYKQNKFTPGAHIPIYSPDVISDTKPDIIVIMPWNLKSEIARELEFTRAWGAKLATFIPEVSIW